MICELQHAMLSDTSYSECSIVSIVEWDKIKKTCHNKHLFSVVLPTIVNIFTKKIYTKPCLKRLHEAWEHT